MSANPRARSGGRPISLAHLTVIELAPPDVVTVAHEAGYDLVDLRLGKAIPEDIEYPMFGDTPMLRETRRRLSDTGIQVFDVEIVWIRREMQVADHQPMFEAAAHLGAKRIKIGSKESDEGFVAEAFAEICDRLAPLKLTADLEFMPFSGTRTLDAAARVVARADRPNAGIVIDTLHFCRSGGKPDDLDRVDPSRLAYAQLCDAPAAIPPDVPALAHEARVARLIPGDGELPLIEILRKLPTGLPISLELPMKELASRLSAAERARLAIVGARRVIALADDAGNAAAEGGAQ